MDGERRRYLRDILDELDRYLEEFEKSIEETVRGSLDAGQRIFNKPVVAGFAMGVGPEGKPTVQFFGDKFTGPDGYRTPIYEQVLDSKEGELRLLAELPGVEKNDIDISALEDKVIIKVSSPNRKYKADIPLKEKIDPDSSRATYKNGLLEVIFKLREKTNKGYRRVRVV
jgi:HSP20 family protein